MDHAIALLAAVLPVTLMAAALRRAMQAERCPSCRSKSVRRWWEHRSNPTPLPWFYRCEACGLRLKRVFEGPWEDASSPEYNAYFADAPPTPGSVAPSYRR